MIRPAPSSTIDRPRPARFDIQAISDMLYSTFHHRLLSGLYSPLRRENGMRNLSIGFIVAAVLSVAAAPAATEILQFEIPATEGAHAIDVGFPVAVVNAASLHITGNSHLFQYHCIHDDMGGHHEYDHQEPMRVYVEIKSDGVEVGTDLWYAPEGDFDADLPFFISGNEAATLLSGGTGIVTLDTWVELFPPESEDCSQTEAGFVHFSAPLLLTLDVEPAVPTESSVWGRIKASYR